MKSSKTRYLMIVVQRRWTLRLRCVCSKEVTPNFLRHDDVMMTSLGPGPPTGSEGSEGRSSSNGAGAGAGAGAEAGAGSVSTKAAARSSSTSAAGKVRC